MTEKPSTSARRSYRKRPIAVTEPKILPMSEQDRDHAVAVLTRWFAELLNDDFRAKVEERARRNHRSDCP